MRNTTIRIGVGLVVALAAGCGSGGRTTAATATSPSPTVLEQAARADSVRSHYTQADVDFMTGMIHHHAQALVMARMAPSHGASPEVLTLTKRILNGQRDEIALMQRWLRDRGEPVPEVEAMDPSSPGHGDHGMHEDAGAAAHLMAGMLTPEQLERLDAARGAEWDRLFLTYMIQHHQGALVMVRDLFDAYGAGQGDAIFKIASDIGADQATEIDRMQRMLQALVLGAGSAP